MPSCEAARGLAHNKHFCTLPVWELSSVIAQSRLQTVIKLPTTASVPCVVHKSSPTPCINLLSLRSDFLAGCPTAQYIDDIDGLLCLVYAIVSVTWLHTIALFEILTLHSSVVTRSYSSRC